jgi:hypothetical protein
MGTRWWKYFVREFQICWILVQIYNFLRNCISVQWWKDMVHILNFGSSLTTFTRSETCFSNWLIISSSRPFIKYIHLSSCVSNENLYGVSTLLWYSITCTCINLSCANCALQVQHAVNGETYQDRWLTITCLQTFVNLDEQTGQWDDLLFFWELTRTQFVGSELHHPSDHNPILTHPPAT